MSKIKAPKIQCLETLKHVYNQDNKRTMTHRNVYPLTYVIMEYGSIENMISMYNDTIFACNEYNLIKSNEYDLNTYIKYIN